MIFFIFLAACYGCDWCFEHNRPDLGIAIGVLFAFFYLANRWFNAKYPDSEDEDDL